jgi:hypothetical protein
LDTCENTHGYNLLELFADNDLYFLNGTYLESPNTGSYTSFQPIGSSVIDYAICSPLFLDLVKSLTVNDITGLDWSDHAALLLCINITTLCSQSQVMEQYDIVPLKHPSKLFSSLDKLLVDVVNTCRTTEESITDLYGGVYYDSDPIMVYTDRSCIHQRNWW